MTPQELKALLAEVTQGDWVAGRYDPKRDEIVVWATDDEYVASIDCDGAFDVKTGPTITANARLIAMAPALARRVIAAEKLVEVLGRIAKCRNVDAFNREGPSYEATLAKAALSEWEAAQ